MMLFYICLSIIAFTFLVQINYPILTFIFRGRRKLDFTNISSFPKVSILKPIKNSDDELGHNLETFFLLDYPDFEIVFGLDSIEEKTDLVIENLRKKYPNVKVKIVPVGKEKLLNPKVETLIAIEKECAGELYWISDSNTRAETVTLKNLVHEYITKGSKIVFSPVKGMGSKTLGSIIENSYLSYYVSGNIIGAWEYIRKPVIIGKSMLVEKKALDGLGGFEYFKQFLAEDQVMGDIFRKHKLPVSSNLTWITNFNSHSTVVSFCSRISRWCKMRYHVSKFFYIGEILSYPIGLSFIFSLFLGSDGLYLFAGSIILKVFFEYINFFAINTYDRKKLWIVAVFPFCVILKDILMLVIYFLPFFNGRVTWRGKHIRIGKETKIFVEPT